jgi:hypothetical protein
MLICELTGSDDVDVTSDQGLGLRVGGEVDDGIGGGEEADSKEGDNDRGDN